MIVAVGDVHGYATKFNRMMTELAARIDFAEDTVVFLGDYVDGGPDTKEIITSLRQYQSLYPHWQFLMGNHEDMLLSGIGYCPSLCAEHYNSSFDLWWYQGGEATARSYGYNQYPIPALVKASLPRDHLEWLRTRPLYYERENLIFVHGGLPLDYFGGNLHPTKTHAFSLLWARDWFEDYEGKPVIYGHTYNHVPVIWSNVEFPTSIGIDTMHHGGGKLTAILIDEEALDNKEPSWYSFIQV